MTRIATILCLCALLADQANAATYYVDQAHASASDSNPGTELLPWLTIVKATTTVAPGDTVYIKGSTNPDSDDAVYDRSGANGLPIQTPGTSGNTITYAAYTGHTVIIEGNGTGDGIALDYASYHEIRGFTFRNFNKAAEGFAATTNQTITFEVLPVSPYTTPADEATDQNREDNVTTGAVWKFAVVGKVGVR